ncbi:MAG: hypothetical protein ACLFVT_09965, partial [Syntrophobacteria bacterium]
YNTPQAGYVFTSLKADPQPVPKRQAKPDRIDRLVAVLDGEMPADELESDLSAAVDSVAIMQACYESSRLGTWVDVPALA